MNIMERVWSFFGMLVLATLVATLICFIWAPKHVVHYDLSGYNGVPRINIDVENGQDASIDLSKDVSWSDAVRLIDSLNSDLAKHPVK